MNNLYLALGDSLTTGYGVGVSRSFATLFYSSLLPSFPGLKYENLGVNGLTSAVLVNLLGQPKVAALIARAKIITITIGSNDLLAVGKGVISGAGADPELALGNLNHNLLLIGEEIRSINPVAVVKIATLYNPIPPVPVQQVVMAEGLVKAANQSIMNTANTFRFTVIPVGWAFAGREKILLGLDHLHPNIVGHKVLADLFARN